MSPRAAILVIDDEPIIRNSLGEYLRSIGHTAVACADGLEALAQARKSRFDMALCDVNLPGMDGHDVVQSLMRLDPEIMCVLVTAYATIESAVEAFQSGAVDYLMKPILFEDLRRKIDRFIQSRFSTGEHQTLRREFHRQAQADFVAGISPGMKQIDAMCRKAGPSRSPVLIFGEAGTGKEALARLIHRYGASPGAPPRFAVVNCAASALSSLDWQLFGHARGTAPSGERHRDGVIVDVGEGTVFLDEVCELPLATQARLLNAVEQNEIVLNGCDRPVRISARIIAATQKDLADEVEQGRFREDLFYRLSVMPIKIPPLRDRSEDVPDLADHLLRQHATKHAKRILGVDRAAMSVLMAAPWRGNVRELDNVLERALIRADSEIIRLCDLPAEFVPPVEAPSDEDDLSTAVQNFERAHIERVLRQTPDKKEAARRLNIGLSSLYRKIEALGIESP